MAYSIIDKATDTFQEFPSLNYDLKYIKYDIRVLPSQKKALIYCTVNMNVDILEFMKNI